MNNSAHEGATQEKETKKDKNFVQVALITTAGSYPADGFDQVPNHQKVDIFVKEATKKLNIVSTEGWIAKVGSVKINLGASYLENVLSGEVSIDYGPEAGGGGCE